MNIKYYPIDKLRLEIIKVVGRHLDLSKYRCFFFGSRVNGNSSERSDIDIGLQGRDPIPRLTLALIRNELEELPTLYKFDVVDFSAASPQFCSMATKHIEEIIKI